jgi:hypothetical protein
MRVFKLMPVVRTRMLPCWQAQVLVGGVNQPRLLGSCMACMVNPGPIAPCISASMRLENRANEPKESGVDSRERTHDASVSRERTQLASPEIARTNPILPKWQMMSFGDPLEFDERTQCRQNGSLSAVDGSLVEDMTDELS